jgi:hypothetical protein
MFCLETATAWMFRKGYVPSWMELDAIPSPRLTVVPTLMDGRTNGQTHFAFQPKAQPSRFLEENANQKVGLLRMCPARKEFAIQVVQR